MKRIFRHLIFLMIICMACLSLSGLSEGVLEAGDQIFDDLDEAERVEPFIPEALPMVLGEDFAEGEDIGESYAFEAENAVIQTQSAFKDAIFRAYVLSKWDADKDGQISSSEASAVKTVDVTGKGIASLAGIEMFTKLTTLKCANNKLTELDLSGNAALTTLICYGNELAKLDLGNCSSLLSYASTICPKMSGQKIYYQKKVSGKTKTVLSIPYDTVVHNGDAIVFDPIDGLSLVGSTASLKVGEKLTLIPQDCHFPAAYCKFKSNSSKVKVDANGVATAMKAGKAKITVTPFEGSKLTCTITVAKAVAPSKVTLSKTQLILGVGQKYQLDAAIPEGTSTTFTWKSGSSSVVSVKDGLLTARKKGTATITVTTANNKKAKCTVKVYPAPTSLSLNPSKLVLSENGTETLSVSLSKGSGCDIELYSDDPSVAEVNSETGVVTAKSIGTATIWAKTYNNLSAKCEVEVTTGPTAIELSEETLVLGVGQTHLLEALALIDGEAIDSTLEYKSSKTSVATVDQAGVITAVKAGSANITVSASNGVSAVCKLKVYNAPTSIKLNASQVQLDYDEDEEFGEDFQLVVTLSKSSAAEVSFSSSNEDVAIVDEGGLITAVGIGSATITAATHNGKSAECAVKVTSMGGGSIDDEDGLIIVAHRGGYYDGIEENTLAAFSRAESTGADMIELDVRTTKDGVQVINHDKTIKVGSKKYTIKSNKYSYLVGKKSNLCTLDEALSLISRTSLTLQLELKDTADVSKCVAAVKKYNMEDRVVYISFHKDLLKKVRKLVPDAKLGLAFENSVPSSLNSTIKDLDLYALMVKWDLLTESRLNSWHNAGLKINVWTINTYSECKYWAQMGVDYITSNYPADAVRARADA